MARKRRRRPTGKAEEKQRPQKRVCRDSVQRRVGRSRPEPEAVHHPVLSLYFTPLFSLRDHLIQTLPSIASGPSSLTKLATVDSSYDCDLSALLDKSLVGISGGPSSRNVSQQIADATQCTTGSRTPSASQPDIVDLALKTLFHRSYTDKTKYRAVYPGKPNNVLTLGYRATRNGSTGPQGLDIASLYPNSQVTALKSPVWSKLLRIIKEDAMLDLLLNTSVFIHLGGQIDKGNYYQLIGPPISDYLNNPKTTSPPLKRTLSEDSDSPIAKRSKSTKDVKSEIKTYGEIAFVRSRMFYAKPTYNSRGNIQFGLRHIHALNRYSDHQNKELTSHVLKYIFPRQFGLHNAFTSVVDRRETVQPFQDYTVREPEIYSALGESGKPIPVPKRLKGEIMGMVAKLQRLQKNCPYHALIKHYCPVFPFDADSQERRPILPKRLGDNLVKSSPMATQLEYLHSSVTISTASTTTAQAEAASLKRKETFMDMASPAGDVSGFARAVIAKAIPNEFWGRGDVNKKALLRTVDRFVKLRRYETLTLHNAIQSIRLADFDWLRPPSVPKDAKMSQTDEAKRRQLLAEFVYWVFDSFLIPLLKAHFYITESNVDRNRMFYFRHDVWKKLSEPALNELKTNMFQELKDADDVLRKRDLGYTQLRLLPKEQGVRPIMNLRKRGMERTKNGTTKLTPSINSMMKPVYDVLMFEKNRDPARMGSSLFSVGDMYARMKAFKSLLLEKGWLGRKLYFAKVDVQACFDTIPQQRLLELIGSVVSEEDYRLEKYAEVREPPPHQAPNPNGVKRPSKKFLSRAKPADEFEKFEDFAKGASASAKSGVVLVDDVMYKYQNREELLKLLDQHVQHNIIKVGKKYFQQKTGIPQGSVLSSILCNFFYAEFERDNLSFTAGEDSLLLRLIDDFLFITLNKHHAEMFVETMHEGGPEYGVRTKHEKTLVNFETAVGGKKIERLVGTLEFPYCGNVINTKTLNIKKDRERKFVTNVNDMITVEYSRQPGSALFRKTVHSFKIQAHPMYFDTTYNSQDTLVKNIYHSFAEAAMKFHRYAKSLNRSQKIRQEQLISVVSQVLELAFVMLKSRQRPNSSYKCAITHTQVKWLGAHAFTKILKKKQTGYKELLKWLDETEKSEKVALRRVGLSGLDLACFEGFRY